ncbi:MAG: hypothetical protein AB7P03_16325 [Kofleriaceae bacterium]
MAITIEEWGLASEQERVACAQALVRQLPTEFSFAGLQEYELGGVRQTVATFRSRGRTFSLVPGGERTIGWELPGTVSH